MKVVDNGGRRVKFLVCQATVTKKLNVTKNGGVLCTK